MMRQDYTPDPLWSMAATPGETYRGWANRQTKAAYDYLVSDPARARNAVELAADCVLSGRVRIRQHSEREALDRGSDRAFAVSEFGRRLDLGALPSTVRIHVDFNQLLDACLEQD